jgi:hypothetical protein
MFLDTVHYEKFSLTKEKKAAGVTLVRQFDTAWTGCAGQAQVMLNESILDRIASKWGSANLTERATMSPAMIADAEN